MMIELLSPTFGCASEDPPKPGSAVEVRLVAWPESPNDREVLVLGTRAEVIRTEEDGVALRFDAPLAY